MEIILMVLGVIVLIGAALLYGSLAWGFVMYKFWYWFLLPVFPSLPGIKFWQAVGLFIFINLFQISTGQAIKEEYKDNTASTVAAILNPWVLLFIGWIIYKIVIPSF
jgi:hypothetical protein